MKIQQFLGAFIGAMENKLKIRHNCNASEGAMANAVVRSWKWIPTQQALKGPVPTGRVLKKH